MAGVLSFYYAILHFSLLIRLHHSILINRKVSVLDAGFNDAFGDIRAGDPAAAAVLDEHAERDLRIVRRRVADEPRVFQIEFAVGVLEADVPLQPGLAAVGFGKDA